MSLTPQEECEFKRLMIYLCLDDPVFMRQLVTRRQGWTRRLRLVRAGEAGACFTALVVLSLSGVVAVALMPLAASLALGGIVCAIGALVPSPVPVRARWLRLRLRTWRLVQRYHLVMLHPRSKSAPSPPDGE